MQDNKLLTLQQVADRLQVSKSSVYNWLRSGRLRAVKAGKLWRVPESALEDFLAAPAHNAASSNAKDYAKR